MSRSLALRWPRLWSRAFRARRSLALRPRPGDVPRGARLSTVRHGCRAAEWRGVQEGVITSNSPPHPACPKFASNSRVRVNWGMRAGRPQTAQCGGTFRCEPDCGTA